jgi:hypothetical protein
MEQIQDGLKHQFAKGIELAADEKAKLLKYVTVESQETEIVQFETFGASEARPRERTDIGDAAGYGHYAGVAANGNHLATPALTEYEMSKISRRQLSCAAFYWAETMDRNDKLNLISDPSTKYPIAAGRAMAKMKDKVIVKSVGSPVASGRTGATPIHFDYANNIVPVGLLNNDDSLVGFAAKDASHATMLLLPISDAIDGNGIAATHTSTARVRAAGLTVDKLIMARQMLNKGTFNSDDKMYFVCSEQQITDLFQDIKITSSDYNAVKSLVEGEVTKFMGFHFIKTEMLTGLAPIRANAGTVIEAGSHSIRECFAFTESSLRFGTVNGSKFTNIEKLERYHYAPSLYHSESFGAARAAEGGVVIVKCLEQTRRDHTTQNGWVHPVASTSAATNKLRMQRASVLPANSHAWTDATYAADVAIVNNNGDVLLELAKKKL